MFATVGSDLASSKGSHCLHPKGRIIMSPWAIVLLVLTLIAGYFAVGVPEGNLAYLGRFLVLVFAVMFVGALIIGRSSPRDRPRFTGLHR